MKIQRIFFTLGDYDTGGRVTHGEVGVDVLTLGDNDTGGGRVTHGEVGVEAVRQRDNIEI